MNATRKASICPVCFTGYLERKVKRVTSTYRGRSTTNDQPGDWCDHCGEGLLTGSDALVTQAILFEWRAHIDNLQHEEVIH